MFKKYVSTMKVAFEGSKNWNTYTKEFHSEDEAISHVYRLKNDPSVREVEVIDFYYVKIKPVKFPDVIEEEYSIIMPDK